MNTKKTKLSIVLFVLLGGVSTIAYSQDSEIKVDFDANKSASNVVQENQSSNTSQPTGKTNIESNEGYPGYMYNHESELLGQKEHTLLKMLYERQQLDKLRGLLDDYENKEAYEDAVDNKVPLSPEQILNLRALLRDAEIAKNAPLQGPMDNAIRTIDIDVDAPKPIVLNVSSGYASSIVFFDHSGSPWPIEGDIIGNTDSFKSTRGPNGKTHIGVFEIKKQFTESNALINLVGLDVPIVVRLHGNDKTVDSRLSVRIPKFGPNSKVEAYSSGELNEISSDSLKVLNGDKLPNGKRYSLNGVQGEVTYANGTLYIRTRANLISPPWKNFVNSATGYKVYELPPVDNLLFAVDGEMVDATIEKAFDVKIKQQKSIFSDK